MSFAIQLCSWVLWFPLKVLGINAIFHAGVRRYPLIFTYMVVTFLFAVAQMPVALTFHRSDRAVGHSYQILHSVGEGCTYTLILAVVISLTLQASSMIRPRRIFRVALSVGGILFMGGSFLVHYDKNAAVGG